MIKAKEERTWGYTFSLVVDNSLENMIVKTGARYTKETPCTNRSVEPKKECRRVDMPESRSTVDTTFAVSSCLAKTYDKNIQCGLQTKDIKHF